MADYGRRITYSPDELALILQIKRSEVFDLIRSGKIKAFHMGSKIRISITEVDRYTGKDNG